MTLIRKVRKNYLQTFKEIFLRGKVLNIHKTTFLCQTHEKGCWRRTRLREEQVYHKKYNFLKYSYDVVNKGIHEKLKFEPEEKTIIEEDAYEKNENEIKERKHILKRDLQEINKEIDSMESFFEQMNLKYHDTSKNATNLYNNVLNKTWTLNKSEFLKKYKTYYSLIDTMLIYNYLKKVKLLCHKRKYLLYKLYILKSRKNIHDILSYSLPIEQLTKLFENHNRTIGVLSKDNDNIH